jgi:TniQ
MPAKSYSAETFWNLEKPLLPSRSQLLPLKPIGIGTLHVESLTGYIARLAQYHSLTTKDLLLYEVLPLMHYRGFQVNSQTICRLFCSRGSLTQENETRGNLVKSLLRSLEELTGQQNLFQLSLLRRAGEIFAFSLLRSYQAWCPICYQEWRNDNRVIYTPLLWLLLSSDICIRHPHQVLLEQCTYCHLRFLALTEQSCPGYCSKCHQWLGSAASAELSHQAKFDEWQSIDDFLDHGLHWQYCWLDGIEQVVANTPSSFLPPKQSLYIDPRHLPLSVKP